MSASLLLASIPIWLKNTTAFQNLHDPFLHMAEEGGCQQALWIWEIYLKPTFPGLGSSPTWISAGWFLVYPALACLVLRLALTTYESNLHCGFNAVSLRNEPNSFKPDTERPCEAFPNLLSSFDERKVVTFAKITVTQYIIIRYFAYSSFSITYLACTWDKHSIDSPILWDFAITCISLSWLPGGSELDFIFRHRNLLKFFSWHIHLPTFFDYFF